MKQVIIIYRFLCLLILFALSSCSAETYKPPPQDILETDLVGVWEAKEGKFRVDKLIIKPDGTYKQIYKDKKTNYIFETNWSAWQLDFLSNERVYLNLIEGRYFAAGISFAERNGMTYPFPCPNELDDCKLEENHPFLFPYLFFDPYTGDNIEMVGKLVLIIRVDPSSEIVLHHFWTSSDRGFALIGGQSEVFRRKKTKNNE